MASANFYVEQLVAEFAAEYERLRSAVVEKAKAWKAAHVQYDTVLWHREIGKARDQLCVAIDNLENFEASHAIGQKDGE